MQSQANEGKRTHSLSIITPSAPRPPTAVVLQGERRVRFHARPRSHHVCATRSRSSTSTPPATVLGGLPRHSRRAPGTAASASRGCSCHSGHQRASRESTHSRVGSQDGSRRCRSRSGRAAARSAHPLGGAQPIAAPRCPRCRGRTPPKLTRARGDGRSRSGTSAGSFNSPVPHHTRSRRDLRRARRCRACSRRRHAIRVHLGALAPHGLQPRLGLRAPLRGGQRRTNYTP
jgi:hypothetical protein